MRRFAIIILSILSISFAIGLFLLRISGGGETLTAAPPPPVAEEVSDLAPRDSVILVRARMKLADAAAAANLAVPASSSGVQQDPVPNPFKDDEARWTVTRGEIAAEGRDGALVLSAPLAGDVALEGKLKALVNVKLKASGRIAGVVEATARPQIAQDWRVVPNLALAAAVSEAEVPIEGLGSVSVKDLIRADVEKAVANFGPALNARMAEDPFLENTAKALWADLCGAHDVVVDGEAAKLIVSPAAFMASQPQISETEVSLMLGLRAGLQATQAEWAGAPCLAMPPPELVAAAPEGEVALALPVTISWQTASELATEAAVKKPLLGGVDGIARVEARKISLGPYGNRVLVGLEFSAIGTNLIGGGIDGTIYATARPAYNTDDARLVLTDIELTKESGQALAGRTALAALVTGMAGSPVIDFGKALEKARRKGEAAILKLASRLPGVDPSGTKIDALAVEQLRLRKDGVEISAVARGTAQAAVLELKLSP